MIILLLLDLSSCGPSGLLRVLYFFKLILDIVFIIIPIGLIILLTIDFSKAMISGDESAQKKTFNLATKRIMYAVIVFFVPTIVSIVNTVLGDLGVDYSVCYNDISLEAINALEAEEIAREEAEEAARLALLEKQKAEEEGKMDSEGYYTVSASECDGMVYYDNGTFYIPSSNYKSGIAGTKGSALYGYNKYFYNMLTTMINKAKEEGYTIKMSTTEYGAWRPYENQEYFWNCYQTQSCNNGNLAARPGISLHGWGIASDLEFGSDEAEAWAHKYATQLFALEFSICDSYPDNCREPWHVVPASLEFDDSVVKKCN